jgi:hypothetical protein
MAEQIISPGVFQNENAPIVLSAAAAPVGAAIIGPTVKGQVGIPVTVSSYSEYLQKFGGSFVSGGIENTYTTALSAQNYFRQGGSNLLVTRVADTVTAYTAASGTNISGSMGFPTVFSLKTISQGANQISSGSSVQAQETTGNALISGSADNLRWEISNANTASGIFDLFIRQGNDRLSDKIVLESWRGVSLDPTRDDYVAKVIGNQQFSIGTEGSDSFVTIAGEYPNNSNYVIVDSITLPTPNYLDGAGNAVSSLTGSIPVAQSGSFNGATGAPIAGTLMYDKITNTQTQGLVATDYSSSINLLKNKDQYNYNVISTPGLIYSFATHKTQLDSLIANTTTRGDSILPIDVSAYGATVASTVSTAATLNTNYAAAYWPWLLVKDENTGANVWTPASTLLPSVYVYNDTQAQAWFAPAGFTRGTMPNVVTPEKTLPRSLRDTLYTGKVNPIATFPGTGVVVYGQKTLQNLSTALDRVNVRRLLITLKDFIGNVSQNLVFEPNSLQTRNSFLSTVNPYLEGVQQNQGLYAFKVIMDDSNNGPDVIDRNELRGAIYLQPVKTAEFIVLDFNLLPTGAEFPA